MTDSPLHILRETRWQVPHSFLSRSEEWEMLKWAMWLHSLCTYITSCIASFFRQDPLRPCRQIHDCENFHLLSVVPTVYIPFFPFCRTKSFSQMLPGVSFIFLQEFPIYSPHLQTATLFRVLSLVSFALNSYCELGFFHIHVYLKTACE